MSLGGVVSLGPPPGAMIRAQEQASSVKVININAQRIVLKKHG